MQNANWEGLPVIHVTEVRKAKRWAISEERQIVRVQLARADFISYIHTPTYTVYGKNYLI
jgi:hypothetical protein